MSRCGKIAEARVYGAPGVDWPELRRSPTRPEQSWSSLPEQPRRSASSVSIQSARVRPLLDSAHPPPPAGKGLYEMPEHQLRTADNARGWLKFDPP